MNPNAGVRQVAARKGKKQRVGGNPTIRGSSRDVREARSLIFTFLALRAQSRSITPKQINSGLRRIRLAALAAHGCSTARDFHTIHCFDPARVGDPPFSKNTII